MSSRKQAHHTHTLRVSSTLERITRAEAAGVPRRRAASRHRIGHNPAGRAAGRSSLPRLCSPLARSDLRLAGVASVPVEGNGETHANPDRCPSRERRRRPPRESAARGGSRAIDARDGVHQRRARAPNLCSSSRPLVGRHGLDGGTGGCVLRRRRPRCRRSGGEEPEGGSANCKTLARGQGQASSSRAVFFPRGCQPATNATLATTSTGRSGASSREGAPPVACCAHYTLLAGICNGSLFKFRTARARLLRNASARGFSVAASTDCA